LRKARRNVLLFFLEWPLSGFFLPLLGASYSTCIDARLMFYEEHIHTARICSFLLTYVCVVVSPSACCHWYRYKCVTGVVLLQLVVLQTCDTCYVSATGSVTSVSHVLCCFHWWCYKRVTRVGVLPLVALQMSHTCCVAATPGEMSEELPH
jgi:hypothetical protein